MLAKRVLLALLIVGPASPLIVSDTYADGLRWSGMWYQLAGLGVVLWGLNERPKALGLASLWGRVTGWLGKVRDRILKRPQTIGPALFTNEQAWGGAEVRAYSDVEISGTIDEQLTAIKGRLRSITDAVVAHDKRMIKLEKETKRVFERERSEREKAVADVRREVKETTLGNTALDLIGVGLFVLGTVFSSIAPSF